MSKLILHIIDYFFMVFHSLLILFNILGWIIPRCRLANFITLSLTAFSWFVMGIWYGFGYCLFTDWHWEVRRQLGYDDDSNSYIQFLILKITGINLSENLVDTITVVVFFAVYAISIYFIVRHIILYRKHKN